MNAKTQEVQSLFERVVGLTPDERRAVLDDACGERPTIRSEVEALVAAHDAAREFLHAPTASVKALDAAESGERPGTIIGRYKLLEEIGEGGFGRVFHAEQLEPVRRQVALKIIKLGMDTRQVMARFEAERQALAMMDHPGIARVFDGGATESGRPYFVMELVRGVPITEFCDANRLTTAERLDLFVRVCAAVQHAHQKGVIHRDIKPSNVLVTLHDGEPVPKVIDFGIAKATSMRLTERTLFTELRQFVGTPEYVSPEQAEMSGLDVDTRADVYSLGVLLYELLVGKTPFDASELRSGGFDNIQRRIRDAEPPRPSTRFSTLGAERTVIAGKRGADAERLGKLLRGDLEWVVMRAIEKSRARRYGTASALADDVRRFLRDEPVEAGPPSTLYRLTKLARRRRGALIASSVVLGALMVALVGTSVGLVRARAAEADRKQQLDIATEERETSQELMRVSQRWLSQLAVEVNRIADGGDPATFGRGLDEADWGLERAPRDETVQVGATASDSERAIRALIYAIGEARGRADSAEARLEAVRRLVSENVPDEDPIRQPLERLLGGSKPARVGDPPAPEQNQGADR